MAALRFGILPAPVSASSCTTFRATHRSIKEMSSSIPPSAYRVAHTGTTASIGAATSPYRAQWRLAPAETTTFPSSPELRRSNVRWSTLTFQCARRFDPQVRALGAGSLLRRNLLVYGL